jgi:endonuclease/exonuclease/phosphatase family metal-dependent hydrolase
VDAAENDRPATRFRPEESPVRRSSPVLAGALGVVLLVDILRIWLPSIITIFGQAAATPPELLGAFALVWFLAAFAGPAMFRLLSPRWLALAGAIGLVGCRLALTAVHGGQPQLYLASVGLLAGLVWLAALAGAFPMAFPGTIVGLALDTVLHTATGTYDLYWRPGIGPVAATGAVGAILVALQAAARPEVPGPTEGAAGARRWLLFGPVLLLWGIIAGSPALATVVHSYLAGVAQGTGSVDGTAESAVAIGPVAAGGSAGLGAAAVFLFVVAALTPPVRHRWVRLIPALFLVVGAGLFSNGRPIALAVAVLITAGGAGGVLALANPDREPVDTGTDDVGSRAAAATRRRGYAAVAGMLGFAVGITVHYAAYDVGYPNWWLPPSVALLTVVAALRGRGAGPDHRAAGQRRSAPHRMPGGRRIGSGLRWAGALALLTVAAGLAAPHAPVVPQRSAETASFRVVAYNIRMGFGLDGRFDLIGLTRAIAGERPDVVALSEVDRGWLLNGGHDTLALLANRLGMRYHFAPAADPLWGDAILTRLPVVDTRAVRLPNPGASTGSQALGVVLDVHGRELVVVSTHLQPPGDDAGAVAEARALARFAVGLAAGRPLVVAGDLNTEPGEPAFAQLRAYGLHDALVAARPLPTHPADAPVSQIDHILVSAGVTATRPVAVPGIASDHLAVAVTLTPPA